MEVISRAHEEIRVEDMYIGKGKQLDRRSKMTEIRTTMQPKIA